MRYLIAWIRSLAVISLLGLAACAPLATDDPVVGAQLRLATPGAQESFEQVLQSQDFNFPSDHGPHPDFQNEWWYYTGNLIAEQGERFGYQLTIFRRGLSQVDVDRDSNFATNQVYFAHFAIASIDQADHRFYERFSRGALGLAHASNEPYEVFLEDWRISTLDVEGRRVRLMAEEQDIALDLELEAVKPLVLHGDGGVSAKGLQVGSASYYLSFTRMKTAGTIRFESQTFQVDGTSWFDHEWSTTALGNGVVGWDWFSLQLDDQQELMLYVLRREDGSIEPVSAGTLIRPDGSLNHLGLEEFSIVALEQWESPASGAVYPMGWLVKIPNEQIELEITPAFKDQEMLVSFIYWEGSVTVQGSVGAKPVAGQGFVELTGYFKSLEGVF
jgi:predicted secreted hydrolase